MRLTLRSLLGYLDDILEPSQTREMGEKIKESSRASKLVTRIKDVLRRRRITAPTLSGPGSAPDPNVVAEYLDNTLPAGKIEDLEAICLGSDVHLAEVGASHQILSIVLGEPVDVSPELRERMYALGSVQAAATAGTKATAETAKTNGAAQSPGSTSTPAKHELPEYLRPRSAWKNLVPVIILLTCAAIWVGLIYNDPDRNWSFSSGTAETNEANGEVDRSVVESGKPAGARSVDPSTILKPTGESQNQKVGGGTTTPETMTPQTPAQPSESDINPPAPDDLPETSTPADMPEGTAVATVTPPVGPDAPMPATVPPKEAEAEAEAPMPGNVPAVVATKFPQMMYQATDGVLLINSADNAWQVLPRRSLLHADDEVAVPSPFDATLNVGEDLQLILRGTAPVTLARDAASAGGGTRVRLFSTEMSLFGVELPRGQVVLTRGVNNVDEATTLTLRLAGDDYMLTLDEPGTVCGIEVIPQLSHGLPEREQLIRFDGRLAVRSGKVTISIPSGETVMLDSSSGLLFVNGQPSRQVNELTPVPEWVNTEAIEHPVFARTYIHQFEESFSPDRPVNASIPALLDDRNPRMAELTAQTLSLTGNYRGMLRGLSSSHEEARIASIIGILTWIRQQPENGGLLQEEVARTRREKEADIVTRLVWGFTPDDAQSPIASAELIDWLSDEDIGIREFAFYHIRQMTNRTYSYRPLNPLSQRSAAVSRWKDHLRKTGALVEPLPQPISE